MRGAAEGAAQPVPCPMRLCHCATVSLCHCVTVSLYSRGHIPSILRRRALPRTVPLRLCAVLRMCSKRKVNLRGCTLKRTRRRRARSAARLPRGGGGAHPLPDPARAHGGSAPAGRHLAGGGRPAGGGGPGEVRAPLPSARLAHIKMTNNNKI
eukprot:9477260-Pyramimonas_sp.AAC.1